VHLGAIALTDPGAVKAERHLFSRAPEA